MTIDPPSEPPETLPIMSVQMAYQGKLPPPQMLAQYEQIIPGLAERIVSMAELQQKEDHQFRHKHLDAEVAIHAKQQRSFDRAQLFAFSLAIICIGAALFLAMKGHDYLAGIIGGTTITGLVASYIAGQWLSQKK